MSRSKREHTNMSQSWVKPAAGARADEQAVPIKVFGVMAMTTLLTFATLMTGYQTLFTQSVFA